MRRSPILLPLMLAVSTVQAGEPYAGWESSVYELTLPQAEIIKRGEGCVVQHAHNDTVVLTGSANGYTGMFGGQRLSQVNNIPGGPVITFKDPENGTITATNRSDFRAYMVTFSVQSSLTLLAKENKFKIKQGNVQILQKNAGYGDNTGYRPLNTNDPSFEKAVVTLQELSGKIAECVQAGPKTESW